MSQSKLICLITGANQGLGYETAKALVQATSPNGQPYHVIIGSRNLANGEKAAEELNALPGRTGSASAVQLEVTSESSAAAAAAKVSSEHGHLDALVNNAGILPLPEKLGSVVTALRRGLDTNVLGPTIVTEAFLPLLLLRDDPRLVFVGSSMGSLAAASDPSSRYYRSAAGTSPSEYRATKAALNMLMVEYHKRYGGARDTATETTPGAGRRVRVWTVDPGTNATNFMGPGTAAAARAMGVQDPAFGAREIAKFVMGERDGLEGRMVGVGGVAPW